MCVKDSEQAVEEMANLGDNSNDNEIINTAKNDNGGDENDNCKDEEKKKKKRASQCEVVKNSQIQNWDNNNDNNILNDQSPLLSSTRRNFLVNSVPLESICEDRVAVDRPGLSNFVPFLQSGVWSHIGSRRYMEDTHVCISNLAEKFGFDMLASEAISLYGVFDGHEGDGAAQFVRDYLPRVIVDNANFPLELEKVITRSYMETDAAFANKCSLESSLSSGTTALTAMIYGRSLLVANAGDCRAVLSRRGRAIEMSKDHKPCCLKEKMRVESLGASVDDGYLNGRLSVTRAIGDWHLEGMKEMSEKGGPLSAEPELKLITLTKDDEFLIIGCDGIWDVFSSQNAVDFARKQLQEHNDVKLCCKQIVEEAMKRESTDNLTVVMVSFQKEKPPQVVPERMRVRRSISAEGLNNLKSLLEG